MARMNDAPSVAFFGSTGGCVLACLALALKNGCTSCALVRDPAKLQGLLRERGVLESQIDSHLTIVKGNSTDLEAVRRTLAPNGEPVDLVISGVGGKLLMGNPLKPVLNNPTICADTVRTVIEASGELERKPTLVVISATGMKNKHDLPLAMQPLYWWLLKCPLADKTIMEKTILEEMKKPEDRRAIRDYSIVRPSFFTDGEGEGLAKIRDGREDRPAVGYTITRNDVGLWLFENFVRRPLHQENRFLGQAVTITF
ncbi:hypothetical protein BDV25DRAFT_165002 [Aspergillus avenaceus]|uniref:NAD(P)-binding domain-containing protein n=1 Tax=Aspergillus avenaceus TaxID=36643 RepID=A0A5N6TGS2_ASPAV|nr:hypothetical protein BDV25DRAFT_165002 [Aspergillus avenaceus]